LGKTTPHGILVGVPKQQPFIKQPIRVKINPNPSVGANMSNVAKRGILLRWIYIKDKTMAVKTPPYKFNPAIPNCSL
jgi:hypothetical protein